MQEKTQNRSRCDPVEECLSASRNRYFLGKRLTPPAFQIEQDYHVERRRLINRSLFGWGVVHGYHVAKAAPRKYGPADALYVGAGLALDRAGRELYLAQPVCFTYADIEAHEIACNPPPCRPQPCEPQPCAPQAGEAPKEAPAQAPEQVEAEPKQQTKADVLRETYEKPREPCPEDTQPEQCWLLSAHYAERWIEPVALRDDCQCDRREWDRICEEVYFSLCPIPCDDCCPEHHCELCCDCVGECRMPLSPQNRGPHRCLCQHLTHLQVDPECDSLCKVEPGLFVDLHNGVPLACVALKKDDCGDWQFDHVRDACGPRRLVKRNDLLFDLIRGCDLTAISFISWQQWHRRREPVPLADFIRMFSAEASPPKRCVTQFAVAFSRPVQIDTLRADCFTMTVIAPEEDTGWGEMLRVPIIDVEPVPRQNDPQRHTTVARLVVDGEWVIDELRSKRSVFRNEPSRVEIEVRGDFILDCNGQRVDANAEGLRNRAPGAEQPRMTGNGSPGGTFISTFSVGPWDESLARTAQAV